MALALIIRTYNLEAYRHRQMPMLNHGSCPGNADTHRELPGWKHQMKTTSLSASYRDIRRFQWKWVKS
jgi:hypothetical protein